MANATNCTSGLKASLSNPGPVPSTIDYVWTLTDDPEYTKVFTECCEAKPQVVETCYQWCKIPQHYIDMSHDYTDVLGAFDSCTLTKGSNVSSGAILGWNFASGSEPLNGAVSLWRIGIFGVGIMLLSQHFV